jgi:UDP-N-acetylmuramate--alanine ligase
MDKIKFRVTHIHFIGIGGSGMNGIAEVLYKMGYVVTGSDIAQNTNTQRLENLGINIFYNHQSSNVADVEVVVLSSAIRDNNSELMAAKKRNIPVMQRAEMLAEIMRFRFGIAISGTHGKTTTTSIIAHIMTYAKLDPTYIIGGVLNADGASNHLGKSEYLVVEADESDGSFLKLHPGFCVITNIDKDHMQTYDFSEENLHNAFIDFTHNLPFYGLCVACIDDDGVKDIIANIPRKVVTYGIRTPADVIAENIIYTATGSSFEVVYAGSRFTVTLPLIGAHNILNCLGAIAICLELGIDTQSISQSLVNFKGANRRLDYKGNITIGNNNIQVFDDYGHHPSEIRVVLEGMRKSFPDKRIIIIFQPHRYSRTRDLFDDFASELATVQTLILLPIYSAGEDELAGISSTHLANNIRSRSGKEVFVVNDFKECYSVLGNIVTDGDIVLTLGAGDVAKIATYLVENYGY